MIPRGLRLGTPIAMSDLKIGDVIDTFDPGSGSASRFHNRRGQTVISTKGSCDIYTDYDMICQHLGLQIQLVSRAPEGDAELDT